VRRVRPKSELWGNADFLWLWAAQSASFFGSQITRLALPLAAILLLGASTFEVAVLGALTWLPYSLFSLPAGVWIDRLPRRPILIVSDWGRALALGSIPLAYVTGTLTLAQLYIVTLVAGTLTMCFDLSYQSYLPTLVARERLGEANSKLEVSRSTAQVAGPGLAGVLVKVLTAPYAILFDSLSFVASAMWLSRIERREPKRDRSLGVARRFRDELGEGLRFVIHHPLQRPIMVSVAFTNIFTNMLFAIFLVYAVRTLGLSAPTIGLIFSLGSVGSVLGALTANRVARALGIGPALICVSTAGGLGLLLIPLASGRLVLPLLIIANVAWGYYVLTYFVTAVSLIQATTPDHLLGRTNASRRFVVQGVIPLGSLLGGALGSQLGLRPAITIGALGASLSVLPLLFSPLRRVKTTDDGLDVVRDVNERFALSG
jgi:MFS family permease